MQVAPNVERKPLRVECAEAYAGLDRLLTTDCKLFSHGAPTWLTSAQQLHAVLRPENINAAIAAGSQSTIEGWLIQANLTLRTAAATEAWRAD